MSLTTTSHTSSRSLRGQRLVGQLPCALLSAPVSAMMATLGHTNPSKPVVHRGGDPRRARSPVSDTADSSEPARKRAKSECPLGVHGPSSLEA